jgi:flagellar biosynthesis anti-sigma factor FlgM
MSASFQNPLNRISVLRYDTPHTDIHEEQPVSSEDVVSKEGDGQMNVNGIGSVGASSPITSIKNNQPATSKPTVESQISSPVDEVEISSAGKALDNLARTSSLRQERLDQIKAAIQNGTYDTDEKLEAALGKFMNVHGLDGSD